MCNLTTLAWRTPPCNQATSIVGGVTKELDDVFCMQGIKFLQTHHIIGESETEVAEYLLKGELLNKRAIGDYLGEG